MMMSGFRNMPRHCKQVRHGRKTCEGPIECRLTQPLRGLSPVGTAFATCSERLGASQCAFSGSFFSLNIFRIMSIVHARPPVPRRGITRAVGRLAGLVLCGLRYHHCIDGLEEM